MRKQSQREHPSPGLAAGCHNWFANGGNAVHLAFLRSRRGRMVQVLQLVEVEVEAGQDEMAGLLLEHLELDS